MAHGINKQVIQKTTSGGGSGDMAKAIYDIDNDGIVDNSENLGGNSPAYYLDRTNHTGTQSTSSINDLSSYTGLDSRYYTETETNTLLSGKSDTSHNHSGVYEPANANIQSHISSTSNPHSVTKSQVGLGNVANVDTTTTANITDSTNKRFVTDAQVSVINNTSGINTGDQTNITGNAGTVTTINGKIAQGTNVTISGSGTSADPYVINSSGGGGGGASVNETEVDFGTKPVTSKKFTITNASITSSSKIIVSPSGNTATGRVGNDAEWEQYTLSARPGTGSFDLSVVSNGHIKGKRKFFYTFS